MMPFGYREGRRVAADYDPIPNRARDYVRYQRVYGKGRFPGWGSHHAWVKIDLKNCCIVRTWGQSPLDDRGRFCYPRFSSASIEEMFHVAFQRAEDIRRGNRRGGRKNPKLGRDHRQDLCEMCQELGHPCC